MKQADRYNLTSQLIVAVVFALIGLAALYVFVKVGEPKERQPQPVFREDYSEQPLVDVLARHGFEDRLTQIADAGSAPGEREVGRLSGSPGFYRTESLILDTYKEAGLEVQTQGLQVTVPVTEYCEILDEDGRPLKDVQLYPFEPCVILPVALPSGGITGRLINMENPAPKYLRGENIEGGIVLSYMQPAPNWLGLASVGIKAVIVREDEIAKAMRVTPDTPDAWVQLTQTYPVPFPRFLARGPIEKYADRNITIRCKVAWRPRQVRNLIGVLRGKEGCKDALVVTCYYDSYSQVPNLAPGAEQSISLAAMLEYVRALSLYRGKLERDIIFVATAGHSQSLAGVCRLMEAIETFTRQRTDYRSFEHHKAEEEQELKYARHRLEFLDVVEKSVEDPEEIAAIHHKWLAEDEGFRKWFSERLKTVAGEICIARKEYALQRKLDHMRVGSPAFREGFDLLNATDAERKDPANTHPLLLGYLAAKKLENRAAGMISLPIWQLISREEFVTWNYAGRLRKYLDQIVDHHVRQIGEINDLIAVRQLFKRYDRTLTINLELFSGGCRKQSDMAILVGIQKIGTVVEPQISELARAITEKVPEIDGKKAFRVIQWGALDAAGTIATPNLHAKANNELESEAWLSCGYLSFTVLNHEFYPGAATKIFTPEDTMGDLQQTEVLRMHVPALGRMLLSLAYGRVPFKTIRAKLAPRIAKIHGTVYANVGTSEMVAGHRMGGNTVITVINVVARRGNRNERIAANRGIRRFPLLHVDPYGRFSKVMNFNNIAPWSLMAVDAARFDADGCVTHFKDDSAASQAAFPNELVPGQKLAIVGSSESVPINVVVFRCATILLSDRSNPTTMKSFKGVEFLNRVGLGQPSRYHRGQCTVFLEPDNCFYIGLRDGAAGNEEIQTYRAFMLNVDPTEPIGEEEPELYGRGYVAADVGTITYPHIEMSESMLRTAEKRLGLQRKYGMADEQMEDFHKRGREWLADAKGKRAAGDLSGAVGSAAAGLAYAMNNHPVIRTRISHAVIGILWYLGLLVPFVFFCEKLLFGFTDIRKQLVADGVIFLVIFALLRVFHPAFQMVRSSFMILLGFIILLLTMLVTMMVGGKFKQNIKELRSKEGRVEGADINRGGVIGTAFMLGLNNMRRRKIRTGFTCMTLVLITFVMICFTSVSTDLASVEYATGRSSWNGIMIRDPNFAKMTAPEVNAITALYGDRFPVTTHQWLVSGLWHASEVRNLEIPVDREFETAGIKTAKRTKVSSVITMNWREPEFSGMDKYLLTNKGWFSRPPTTRKEKLEAARRGYKLKRLVILPDNVASDLGISVQDVNNDEIIITIHSHEYEVLGIFDSVAVSKCLGLDGKSIMPYDLNTVQAMGTAAEGKYKLIPEDIGRLPGSQVVIVNQAVTGLPGSANIYVSVLILFPKKPYRLIPDGPELSPPDYREQRRSVLEYLERRGKPAYYATDGICYYGSRRRARSLGGMLDLLVPILIAALAVFNTMRGSVYERREEIYVYNAVGIAPNHVFFMFIAEACVYAVVGAMLGYILSQGAGRMLTSAGLTGGLNMDYSSIETIYASLAIMGSVLLSTILPARDAARMAAPSKIRDWATPESKGDVMSFTLPFTFTAHDRVAVISYFCRWLDAHGAGSSGTFFCSPPEARVNRDDTQPEDDRLVPGVESTVWLKPYDLGVSQKMTISLPTDPETGEYIANVALTRLSGHATAWNRTVRPFLGVLRKQFLNWRATTDAERKEMFAEAKASLMKADIEG